MRDTVMTDRDLARLAAKENLSTLASRPGYAEAMRAPQHGWTSTIVCLGFAAVFGFLTYASWENIAATWLRWVVVVLFCALAVFAALAALGSSPSVERKLRWGVAIVDKHHDAAADRYELIVLRQDGAELRLPTSVELHDALRVGDVGVAIVATDDPHDVASFKRL